MKRMWNNEDREAKRKRKEKQWNGFQKGKRRDSRWNAQKWKVEEMKTNEMKVDAKDILSQNSIFRLFWKAVKIHANFTSRLNAPARLAACSNKRQLICWTGRSSVPWRLLSKLSRSATLGSEIFRLPTLGFTYEWRDQTFSLRTSDHGRYFCLQYSSESR